MVISIDFDGCVVSNAYPQIGVLMNAAKNTICAWKESGHTVIVNTCRDGEYLSDCIDFLNKNGIKYDIINDNCDFLINKYGSNCRKISADVYFDDKNMGGFCGWQRADAYVQWLANRKPVIFAIVGESASGKTTLAEFMESEYGIPQIQSYTTRPKRSDDEAGHTFITKEEFAKFDMSEMIAHTRYGDDEYCCLKKDVKAENTYTISEDGLEYLLANFPEYDVKTIRCYCAEAERIKRAGAERVARDKGRFKLDRRFFDLVWETDSWRDSEYYKNKKLTSLHTFVMKSLNRGWN